MLENFERDLKEGRVAEEIVKDTFSALTDEFTFESVGADRSFFYRGDILAINKDTGKKVCIEVKRDTRIWETMNVLCEEEVYYKRNDYYGKGNMSSDYDIYVVVSPQDKKIYVIDFCILKANYRKGQYKEIVHPAQTTYCYLLGLGEIKRMGGLLATIDYREDTLAVSDLRAA